jgi:hypothetical protein
MPFVYMFYLLITLELLTFCEPAFFFLKENIRNISKLFTNISDTTTFSVRLVPFYYKGGNHLTIDYFDKGFLNEY